MKNSNVFRKTLLVLIAAVSFYISPAQSRRDIKFAKCAADDGLMEVQLGKLALTKAYASEVKMHAQHMIDDHGKANEELKALAAKKNIMLPTAPSEKKMRRTQKLNKLQGDEFDKRYSKCMVRAHKKAICKFRKEAKRGKDAELKAWANEKLPTLQSHLGMWKETCKLFSKKKKKK